MFVKVAVSVCCCCSSHCQVALAEDLEALYEVRGSDISQSFNVFWQASEFWQQHAFERLAEKRVTVADCKKETALDRDWDDVTLPDQLDRNKFYHSMASKK